MSTIYTFLKYHYEKDFLKENQMPIGFHRPKM